MEDYSQRLLAVDLGLRTAWSLWNSEGRLTHYDSRRFSSKTKLKSGVWTIVCEMPTIDVIVAEGDSRLAKVWFGCAKDWETELVQAIEWRSDIFPQRLRRTGSEAKESAMELATEIAQKDGCSPTKPLHHDLAEAILLGYWAVLNRGWRYM
jgi:hypothetical protein